MSNFFIHYAPVPFLPSNNALVVVARHLARVIWRMLTDNREFLKRPPKTGTPTGNRRKPK